MKQQIGYLLLLVGTLGIGLLLIGQLGMLEGAKPQNLGVQNGLFLPPSKTSNSVSSQAHLYREHPQKDNAEIAALKFSGDGAEAMLKLADLLQKLEQTTVVQQGSDYIYAQCRTPLLKFTDDIEFWLDKPNNVIQVRSASRLGQKDFGTNRARVETIRALFSH
jgi:uncharacterized protein (DUF1499 family)